jgi:hypothetical protein
MARLRDLGSLFSLEFLFVLRIFMWLTAILSFNIGKWGMECLYGVAETTRLCATHRKIYEKWCVGSSFDDAYRQMECDLLGVIVETNYIIVLQLEKFSGIQILENIYTVTFFGSRFQGPLAFSSSVLPCFVGVWML